MEAYKIVPLILIAVIFQLWTGFCNIGLFLKEKTKLYGLSALIAVVSSIILNFLLIPRYGVYGAGLTAIIVFGIRFFVVYIFSQRYYYINYGWGNVLKLCFLIMIVYGVRCVYGNAFITTSVSVSIGLVLILIGLIYIVFLDMNEKSFIKNIMMRPLSIITFLKQVR
jgi:O-antigen/teichoic acid export membrane protein